MKYFMILAFFILAVQTSPLEKRDADDAELASEKRSEVTVEEADALMKRSVDDADVALEKRHPHHHHHRHRG